MSLFRRLTRVAGRNVVQQPATPPPSRGDGSAKIVANIASLAGERRYADAYNAVNRALENAPADTALLFAKGSTLLDWGRFGESRQTYEEAERNGLRSVGLYRHLGWACFHGGDLDAAERYLRRALLAGPNDFDALFCLGVVLQAGDAHDEAADVLAQALALRPNDFQARLMLGNSQLAHGNSAAAESCYRNAASIDPSHPAAWVNLGSALRRQGKLIEALAAFERAYELERENGESDADVFLSLALGWTDVGRLDEARRVLEANLALRPSVQAHYNYGLVLLQSGDLQEGWRHHEFRWLLDDKPSERAPYEKPVWNEQDLAGRTLLVRAEQGFGDTIQFLRYAKPLKDRGARVLLKIPSELEKLCKNIPGVDEILPTYETPLDFDFYVHTLSLGAAFGTTLESIPSSTPYIAVDPERKSRWKARLGPSTELAVGLVWAGSPKHKRDRHRSMPLKQLEPLFDIPGVRFISLQKGSAVEEIDSFAPAAAIVNLGPELEDFADAAAVIDQLDLVIGVDTAVVHLAGALARPVWTLIPTPCDWRWLVDRDDSPWYPTMRLFRQRTNGDWQSVVERVRTQLEEWVRRGAAPANATLSSVGPANQTEVRTTISASDNFSAVAETRYGIIQYLPQPAAIAKSLQLYGEYLQSQIDMLRRVVQANDTIVEVGAGVGAHTIALASLCNNVVAYEEDPIARRVLRQNLSANKVRNITVMSATGTGPNKIETTNPSRSLAIDGLALTRLALIKVNEPVSLSEVIAGAEGALWRLRPAVFAAVTDPVQQTAFHERMVTFGYRCWRVETPLFNADNFNLRQQNVFGGRSALAVLAIPEEVDIALPPACDEIR